MKKWFLQTFLPMWAKETLLRDNRALSRKVKQLQQENEILSGYIRGMEQVLRSVRRGGGKA